MTNKEKELFARLCREDKVLRGSDGDGIGTYNEKRFHRIYKRLVTPDAYCYEVKIGPYTADVFCDGRITEIQTGSFHSLIAKVKYYLTNTDFNVTIVKPLVSKKRIIRTDKETGVVHYERISPRKQDIPDAICELYYLRDFLVNERLTVQFVYIEVDEYRYSERIRRRRTGAYENDAFPVCIVKDEIFCGGQVYGRFLPQRLRVGEFDVKTYSAETGLKNKAAYSALNILCETGYLDRRKEGNRLIFRCK